MEYTTGNNIAKAWADGDWGVLAHAIVDIFNDGMFTKEAVKFCEDAFPDKSERTRRIVLLGVYQMGRVDFWAKKLHLPQPTAMSLKDATMASDTLLTTMRLEKMGVNQHYGN